MMTDNGGSAGSQVWIGGGLDTLSAETGLNGLIDEVYMFSRALSQAEVQALYNNNNLSTNSGNVLPPTTPVNVASGATLDLGGVSQTIASLSGSGVVTNTGSAATLTVSNNTGTTTFSGSIGDTSADNAVSFIQSGSATNILSGANTYRGVTLVNGGALFVNGSLGSGAVTNGALLGGNGTLGGALTVKSGGTLSPGTGIGKLAVNSSVTLQTGSTTMTEISKSPQTSDQLLVSGALNYGGTLVVTNLGGALGAADSFTIFQATNYTGRFTAFNLPPLGAGLAWNTNSLAVDGTLRVTLASPPAISATAFDGTNFIFQVTNSAPGSGYSVLMTTDLTLPLKNWSLLLTGQFSVLGNPASITNGVNSATQQMFFRFRVP